MTFVLTLNLTVDNKKVRKHRAPKGALRPPMQMFSKCARGSSENTERQKVHYDERISALTQAMTSSQKAPSAKRRIKTCAGLAC